MKNKKLDSPIINPTIERKTANTQNAGAKAETKLNRQQKKPQTNSGSFRPNLSEMVLTQRLPAIKPAKITDVERNPREPRLQTSPNCKKKKTKKTKYTVKLSFISEIIVDGVVVDGYTVAFDQGPL